MIKNLPANAGDMGSIPGLGKSCERGNGNLLQYSCLGNPMDRGAWQATVHGVTKEWDMNRLEQRLANSPLKGQRVTTLRPRSPYNLHHHNYSVQFSLLVVSDSLRPHGLQHPRLQLLSSAHIVLSSHGQFVLNK